MQLQFLGLVLLSMILGAIIGCERETAGKPAGLRTHRLVSGAAALLSAISRVLVIDFGTPDNLIQADPIRVRDRSGGHRGLIPGRGLNHS